MRFEVLTKVNMSLVVGRVVTPCGGVDAYRRFGEHNPEPKRWETSRSARDVTTQTNM
jgi:hypothetical protein